MSAVCKTEPGETEPTTVLPDPAEEKGFVVKEEEETVFMVKEEEKGFMVKEERKMTKEEVVDDAIWNSLLPSECRLYLTTEPTTVLPDPAKEKGFVVKEEEGFVVKEEEEEEMGFVVKEEEEEEEKVFVVKEEERKITKEEAVDDAIWNSLLPSEGRLYLTTEPGQTEPTTVLPDPACRGGRIEEEENVFTVKEEEEDGFTVKEEEEDVFTVKEEEEEKKISKEEVEEATRESLLPSE